MIEGASGREIECRFRHYRASTGTSMPVERQITRPSLSGVVHKPAIFVFYNVMLVELR